VALLLLGGLGLVSLGRSALPAAWGAPAGLVLVGYTAAQVRRYRRAPPRVLVIPGRRGPAQVDGLPVSGLRVEWRGPLAWISWRRGRRGRHYLMFWPDTLPARQRRELRLAAGRAVVTPITPAMAP